MAKVYLVLPLKGTTTVLSRLPTTIIYYSTSNLLTKKRPYWPLIVIQATDGDEMSKHNGALMSWQVTTTMVQSSHSGLRVTLFSTFVLFRYINSVVNFSNMFNSQLPVPHSVTFLKYPGGVHFISISSLALVQEPPGNKSPMYTSDSALADVLAESDESWGGEAADWGREMWTLK